MECKVCLEEKPPEGKYILRTYEITEKEIEDSLKGFKFETYSSSSGIDILFENESDFKKGKEILKNFVYAQEPKNIEEVLGEKLRSKGFTLSVAESCTGGLLGARIVNVPGSSEYFKGGIIAYSNKLKVSYLCVNEDTLKRYGAVSWQTCIEMLLGLKNNFNTDTGIAITGIAGPGGTERKPEGLTYIGVYVKTKIAIIKRIFKYGRNGNRFASTQTAFFYLLKLLERV